MGPARRKAVEALLKGGLDAMDIEIDALNINPTIKDLLHNLVKGADTTVSNALADKKVLERANRATLTKVPRDENTEEVEQPTQVALPQQTSSSDEGTGEFQV